MLNVYLVDDHEVVRRGVRELLESEDDIAVVGEAGTQDARHWRKSQRFSRTSFFWMSVFPTVTASRSVGRSVPRCPTSPA